MRTAPTVAGLVLAMSGLVGCGGDGGSEGGGDAMPTDASEDAFCGNFEDLLGTLAKLDPDSDASAVVAALRDSVDRMRETGTPSDIPDDARHGFELTLDSFAGLGDDATAEDIDALGDSFTDAEQADYDAFGDYVDRTCALG